MASKTVGNLLKINIDTPAGKRAYRAKKDQYFEAIPELQALIDDQALTPITCQEGDVYKLDQDWFAIVKDNAVYVDSSSNGDLETISGDDGCEAYVVPYNKKLVLLIDGDENDNKENNLVSISNYSEMPTISFGCLNQFYKDNQKVVQNKIKNNKIIILDFVPDSRLDLTAAQKRRVKNAGVGNHTDYNRILTEIGKNPPQPGYTLIGSQGSKWHRAATVLLYDTETKCTILMGQDEGTYFGVELADPVKTIDTAYDSLIPTEVKGKVFVRQGEWFIINVNEKEVPAINKCTAEFDSTDEDVWLPRDDDESNKHFVTGRGRVSREGVLYVQDPYLAHTEHANVHMSGWCRFYKNTAIRSFSQEGVD